MITRPILAGSTRTTRVRWGHRGIDSLRVAFLHTCYRITDIDRSVAFYSALGFEEIRARRSATRRSTSS